MGTRDDAVILRAIAVLLCSAWILAAGPPTAAALWLSLPPSATKCVSEEIHAGVVALADYAVVHDDDPQSMPTISAKVIPPFISVASFPISYELDASLPLEF